jgi:Tfp pilus assembly protein PilP
VYEARGRRDPFLPLIAPKLAEGKPQARSGLASLQVNELKLAGIIWGQRSLFALVEAANGAGYVLRINDVVGTDARVTNITPQAVTFEVKTGATLFQPARTRVLELRLRKEE